MSDVSATKDDQLQPLPETLRWQSWPAREKPLGTAALVVALAGAAAGIYLSTGRVFLAAAAAAALAASLWRFFLPVVFELNEKGIDQRIFGRPRRTAWQAVRRYTVCSAGVLLLPHEDRSPLGAIRGLYVPFSTHRDEILTRVHCYLDRADVGQFS